MRKFRLFALLGMLLAVGRLSAQDQYLYANQVDIEPGGNAEITVNMDLDLEPYEKVGLCFFLLNLPEGIEVDSTNAPAKSCILSAELVGELDESSKEKALQVYDNYGGKGRMLVYLDVNKCSSTLKGSRGELLRMSVRSTLGEALTFTPQITYVHIADDTGLPFVSDGVREKRNDYNTLYIDDMEACTGDELTLSVKMANKMPCEAFSFLMLIPGGTSFVKDEEGNPLASLAYGRISPGDIATFEVDMKDDNLMQVLVTTDGTPFSGNDGEVFTVRIRIGDTMEEGSHDIMLYDVSVADVNAVSYDMPMKNSRLKVTNMHRGDANGDGNLTVADMTAIAHHVLGLTPGGFSEEAADANRDGQVDVADYTAVAHLLLYGSIGRPAGARGASAHAHAEMQLPTAETGVAGLPNTVYIETAEAAAGEELALSVKMKNAVDAEGFQFTLTLPEGASVVCDDEGLAKASLSTERTTAARTNTFAASMQPDGTLKVMAASTNGSAIGAGDGEVCTVKIKVANDMAEGDYAMLLTDVAVSDTQARSHDVPLVEATLTVNATQSIEATAADALRNDSNGIYDLQGRKTVSGKSANSRPHRGVYISKGKKRLMKWK